MRRSWARWFGAVLGVALAALAFQLVTTRGGVIEHVLLFAALATAALLVVPVTGDPARGAAPRVAAASNVVGPVGWTALVSFVGLLAVGLSTDTDPAAAESGRENGLPASAIGRRVEWADFDSGLARARAEAKPVLATFVTDWCPYCTKMSRKTWRAASVAERLDDVVPVRVDVEDRGGPGGTSGAQLAERYGVGGYPVQMLLDPEGRVLARFDGYQGPRELLAWIDRALVDGPASAGAAALTGSMR
jgi:thiol:disulfide interchange protein